MKGFRKVGIMLSVACAITLALGICISQASTDVLWVQPKADTCSRNIAENQYVAESFTATVDTIKTASFFCGNERDTGYYYGYINTSPNPGGIAVYGSSAGLKYQDVVFTFNAQVTRGQRYYFVVQHTGGGTPQGLKYYYREGTAYTYGSLYVSGTQDTAHDLCARVTGVTRTDSTFWGVNGEIYVTNKQNSLIADAKDIGVAIDREQIQWAWLQPFRDSGFKWTYLDTLVSKAQAHGLRVMINFYYTPAWASSAPDTIHHSNSCNPDSVGPYWDYPPRNLDIMMPADTNYLWNFAYALAARYGPQGVHDYEVYNEVGYYTDWRYGRGKDKIYYKQADYDTTPSGRAKLYVKACQVAYNAIKAADPQAIVYTNAIGAINEGADCESLYGKQWLQYFYDAGGKNYSDVITYHWYLDDYLCYPDTGRLKHKFLAQPFIADYDTLRRVMRDNGDGAKPVWADEGGYGTPDALLNNNNWYTVSRAKQADIVVQATVTGLGQRVNGNGPTLNQMNWYKLYDRYDAPGSPLLFYHWAGLVDSSSSPRYKPSAYAYKQMKAKLMNLYVNSKISRPDTTVNCYEFQIPGSDTALRTWCLWKDTVLLLPKPETLSIRTNVAYLFTRDTTGSPDSIPVYPLTDGSGKAVIPATNMDTIPRYLHEVGAVKRPDVIVDDLYTYPPNPRAGDSVWLYARLKNIGNDSLWSTLPDTVSFQVDGVTIVKYKASRGLGPINDTLKDTLTVGPIAGSPIPQISYGDHLIRAWADSADRFAELREDNNMAYIWKHMSPKGTINIPGTKYGNGRKFSKVRPVNLSLLSNGGTTPSAAQMKIKNSWDTQWRSWQSYATSLWDTLPTTDGLYKVQAEFKMATGETSAIAIDSIVLDQTFPVAKITSPAKKATVSGTVPFYGFACDSGLAGHFKVDTLRYFRSTSQHDTIHVSLTAIGEKDTINRVGLLGNWNTSLITNGWSEETLAVWDSAGNWNCYWESLNVYNNSTTGGASWFASGFGTYPSLTMNVATDPGGNVYIAETQGSKLRKFSPHKDSLFAFSAKRGGDSTGLSWAVSMVLKDSTILYVADGYAHAIKEFDLQGNLLLRFGSFGTNPGQFRQPCGIALDPKGRIWVSDRLNNRIQVFDSTGKFLFKFGSQGTDSGGKFNSPTGIAITKQDTLSGIAQDLVWVADTKNNRVQVFDSLGNWVKTISQVDSLGLDTPLGLCSDKWGDVFIADSKHNRIVELNPFGQRILDFGGQGDSLCQFQTPVGVASSPGAHFLYVADMGNKRVQRFWVIQGDSTGGGGPQTQGPPVQMPPKVNFLNQSHPNPVTGEAVIEYGLAKESPVTLTIYNVAGQVVREYNQGKQKAWYYSIQWDGRSNYGHKVGCGVYFYRLKAGDWAKTRKMVVVR